MNRIYVLDCTLRDGGYNNNWQFGEKNIREIISNLIDANVDIIECGFLTEKKERDSNSSLFDSVERISEYLPSNKDQILKVCMVNFGEYDAAKLPEHKEGLIDGIRVAFHKKDMEGALEMCRTIIKKGYKLFMQPMVTVSYSDTEFINLIRKANELEPYAFYIVDSFGVMKRKDLLRLFYLVDHNLSGDIIVGYHSHNNIQMAYSNAQALVDLKIKRTLIIDSSVFGMGRGAGNLNTELFIEYLNEINGAKYKIKPVLRIIDQVLNPIYANSSWGYSLPYYISAMNDCHPNYASYLDDKNTLTVEDINDILHNLDDSRRNHFDKGYVEKLYILYQDRAIADENAKKILNAKINGKTAVIIAPGSSINDERKKIMDEISKDDNVCFSINFRPEQFKCDYVFVSNLRRYEAIEDLDGAVLIETSNINSGRKEGLVVNYSDLLNDVEAVEDNSCMMLIKLLSNIGIKKIKLAGLDGYSHDIYDNFADKNLAFIKSASVMDAMNRGMEKMLERFGRDVEIEFITAPRFVNPKT